MFVGKFEHFATSHSSKPCLTFSQPERYMILDVQIIKHPNMLGTNTELFIIQNLEIKGCGITKHFIICTK